MRAALGIALATGLALTGCARNGIFELEIDLPTQPAGAPLFAVIEATTEPGFDTGAPLPGVALPTDCARPDPPLPCEDRTLDPTCSEIVSVLADESQLEQPLRVQVRFCRDPACAMDPAAPAHRVEIERAFYAGRYSQGRTCIDAVPTTSDPPPQQIERCEVRCREGTAAMSCRLDGSHFCEDP